MDSFQEVQRNTQCPFAKAAKIVQVSTNTNSLSEICQQLRDILCRHTQEQFDAALVIIPTGYIRTLRDIGSFLYQILFKLDADCMKGVETPEWRLYLFGEKFFVAVFWEGFDSSSPRKCEHGAFILFQPKSSFIKAGLLGGKDEENLRLKIRDRFAKAGQAYGRDVHTESERFLPGIQWWHPEKEV